MWKCNKFGLCGLALLLGMGMWYGAACAMTQSQKASSKKMSSEQYNQAREKQNEIHGYMRMAKRFEQEGNHKKALAYYLKAYEINQCAGLIAVCRNALAKQYEALGEYEKALEHVEWGLQKLEGDKTKGHIAELYKKDVETKQRLLKKIEEQKKWESKQDLIVPQAKAAFDKAGYGEQKQFLESLGGEGVLDVFKDAMVAEHSGDYEKAREIYESLLPKKEEIDTQMGVGGWAMLYPAIQRTSELLGDEKREKEALVWIKDNLLNPNGEQHASLSKLQPQVIAHIQKRIEGYQL